MTEGKGKGEEDGRGDVQQERVNESHKAHCETEST